MKVLDFLLNILFPPLCISCEEPLGVYSTAALCPACLSTFCKERAYVCPTCAKEHKVCACLPQVLGRYAADGIHLAEYTKEASVTRDLILYAKEHNDSYLYRFLGEELAAAVRSRIDISGILVTFVPRSAAKRNRIGVDQSKAAAEAMAKALGLSCLSLFRHRSSRAQKALSAAERMKNARAAYTMKASLRPAVMGKRVILYDDVITTGATMAACAKLLRQAGAKEVIPVSTGMTYKNKTDGRRRDPFPKVYRAKKSNLPF